MYSGGYRKQCCILKALPVRLGAGSCVASFGVLQRLKMTQWHNTVHKKCLYQIVMLVCVIAV